MIILYIFIGLVAFALMEFVAWSNHKCLMHGALWTWHQDHHRSDSKKAKTPLNKETKHFEKNDRFFVMYTIPALILMIAGFSFKLPLLVALGIGISAYGMVYFLIHDVIIHQRLPLPILYNIDNGYIRAIRRAHLAHHRPNTKSDFHNYGLLIFPKKFFKE